MVFSPNVPQKCVVTQTFYACTVAHQFFFLPSRMAAAPSPSKNLKKVSMWKLRKHFSKPLDSKLKMLGHFSGAWTRTGATPNRHHHFHANPASNYRYIYIYIKEPGRESLGCFWPLFVRWCLFEIALSDRTVTIGLQRRNLCKGALTLVVPLDK